MISATGSSHLSSQSWWVFVAEMQDQALLIVHRSWLVSFVTMRLSLWLQRQRSSTLAASRSNGLSSAGSIYERMATSFPLRLSALANRTLYPHIRRELSWRSRIRKARLHQTQWLILQPWRGWWEWWRETWPWWFLKRLLWAGLTLFSADTSFVSQNLEKLSSICLESSLCNLGLG